MPATTLPAKRTNPVNPVQLCFGSVRHERLRPAPNRFDYGVFFLRLPLRTMVPAPSALSQPTPVIQTRLFSHNCFNLLSFHDRDHGDGQQPLLAWIDGLLKREGVDDANGEIWLQAFPRVFGFVFNPVSFWFCHRSDGALRAILCEVCNTFGEKHCYLLDTHTNMPYGVELTAKKIFHVSPFCAIEGRYRFRFMRTDPAASGRPERTVARIDHDDDRGPLLLTSIEGTAQPLTDRRIVQALLGYPFLTFGVVARIHWQALRLWIKRVPFFRKPAPPTEGLSR